MILLLLACGGSRPPAVTLDPAERLVFQDVAIYPGQGPDRLLHQDLTVDQGRISAILPTGGPLPEGAQVVSGVGRTLLPGLVDAHTHVTAPLGPPWKFIAADPSFVLETHLRAGVTTVYDLGGEADTLAALRADTAQATPRLYWTASSITWPGAHPIATIEALLPGPLAHAITRKILVATGPEDAAAQVDAVVSSGADYVKIIYDSLPASAPHMSAETLRALIGAAHEREKLAFVHIGTMADALDAAEAGADLLAHAPSRGEVTEADAARLAALGVPVVATLNGYLVTRQLPDGAWRPSGLDRQLQPPEVLAAVAGEAGRGFGEIPLLGEVAQGVNPQMGQNVATLRRAGVPILAGTDSPLPASYPGSGLHSELVALVEQAGFTPAEALEAATGASARAWGSAPDFGAVVEGATADLLLVEGDPTADIHDLDRIALVLRAGRVVRASDQ